MSKLKEIEFLGNKIDQITKERNKYRSQGYDANEQDKGELENELKILKELSIQGLP